MNRRVVLTLTDGSGRVIKEGGIGDVINGLTDKLDDLAKKQQECCDQILKRLDKLDDILAQLKNLQGENDKLQGEVGDLRNQQNALKDQVNGLPKPLTASQTQDIAHTEAIGRGGRSAEAQQEVLDCGRQYRSDVRRRTHRRLHLQRHAASSSRRSAATARTPCRRRASTSTTPGRQEGQFDIGLVNRWGNVQAGAFGSFKYLNFKEYPDGRRLGSGGLPVRLHLRRAAASACSARRASRTPRC